MGRSGTGRHHHVHGGLHGPGAGYRNASELGGAAMIKTFLGAAPDQSGIDEGKLTMNADRICMTRGKGRFAMAFLLATASASPAWATLDNTATVNGTLPNGNPVYSTGSEPDSQVQVNVEASSPEFTVTKTVVGNITVLQGDDTDSIDGGDVITYRVVVANTGNVSLTNVALTDPGPAFDGKALTGTAPVVPTTPTSATEPAAANLTPGNSWTYEFTYTLTQEDVDNAAGITDAVSNTLTSVSAEDTKGNAATQNAASVLTVATTIPLEPGLQLTKIATRGDGDSDDGGTTPYAVGDVITYEFEVRNTGNVTVTNIDVTETAFEGGTPVTITCPGATVPSNRIATMAPGGTVTCSGTYTVTESDVLNDD
ncbi:MAG: hypothetical protein CMJ42_02335 [Phyllobacteriaceae bacterium]|nr:hypothetical protein [Phyllobacteriaceae bacterium]